MPARIAAALMALLALSARADLPIRPAADAARIPVEIGRGRPAVLHFWATWCAACKDEFQRIRPVLLRLPDRGVAVALVSIDRPEQRDEVKRELSRFGLSALPSFLLDAPEPDPVAKAVGDPSWDGTLPATFLFDGRGKLLRSFIGQSDPAAVERAATSATRPPGRRSDSR